MQNKNFKVLIVEDDPLIQLDLVDRLESLGFLNIETSDNGEEVIKKFPDVRPDIIIMDIELAGQLDGIETIEKIRSIKNVPTIFLTDNIDSVTFQKALSTKPVAFLHKPFNDLEVAQNIEIAMLHYNYEEEEIEESILVTDGLFANTGEGLFTKVPFESIRFLDAGRAYCDIYVLREEKPLVVAKTLKVVFQILQNSKFKNQFLRVQKSYVVNTKFITGFKGRILLLDKDEVKTSPNYISDLKSLFHTL